MNKCITETRAPTLKVAGKAAGKKKESRLFFKNKKQELLVKVKLEGCYAKHPNKKYCSYLVRHKGTNYYIELKSESYEEAFMRILNAIDQYNKKDFNNDTCKAIVVTIKSPLAPDFIKSFRKSKLRHCISGEIIREISGYKHPLS